MKVSIIMGSLSDEKIAIKAIKVLKNFGVNYEVKIISAHRSMQELQDYCTQEKETTQIYIGIAGKAAHLAGVIAGLNIQPVIGVPVESGSLMGLDALLATVQMPSGVPVATVALNAADNAALLAVQILAISNSNLQKKLQQHKIDMAQKVKDSNRELNLK